MADQAEQIIGLYQRRAHDFDRERGGTLLERGWLDRFAALLPRGGSILDLGCPMGEPIARHLIERGHALTGIDSSPAMIALCRSRFRHARIVVADMRTLDLGSRHHGILAWDSCFHLRRNDQRAMFPVFRAHAAPGAALMFTSGPRDGEAFGSCRGEPLYHASLALEEYRALLERHGFDGAHKAEDPECGGHTIWLARLRP